jgi:hypothetical protein
MADINKCKITMWEKRSKNGTDWGKVHYGGTGPLRTIVPSKEEEEEEEEEEKKKKK